MRRLLRQQFTIRGSLMASKSQSQNRVDGLCYDRLETYLELYVGCQLLCTLQHTMRVALAQDAPTSGPPVRAGMSLSVEGGYPANRRKKDTATYIHSYSTCIQSRVQIKMAKMLAIH